MNTRIHPFHTARLNESHTQEAHLLEQDGLVDRRVPRLSLKAEASAAVADTDWRKLEKISAQHQLNASERSRVPLHPEEKSRNTKDTHMHTKRNKHTLSEKKQDQQNTTNRTWHWKYAKKKVKPGTHTHTYTHEKHRNIINLQNHVIQKNQPRERYLLIPGFRDIYRVIL